MNTTRVHENRFYTIKLIKCCNHDINYNTNIEKNLQTQKRGNIILTLPLYKVEIIKIT